MGQEIVAAAVVAADNARNAATHTMKTAVIEDAEAGLGFPVKWTARNQLKPTLVAKDLGFVELAGLSECFQGSYHASG